MTRASNCRICGVYVPPKRYSVRRKYCSAECSVEAGKRRDRAWRKRNPDAIKAYRATLALATPRATPEGR